MADQNRDNNTLNNNNNNTGRRNPADNLTHQDRVRGGERSAQLQNRDQRGQFAGRKKNEGGGDNRGNNPGNDNRGGGGRPS
jgi:hypothetical protein